MDSSQWESSARWRHSLSASYGQSLLLRYCQQIILFAVFSSECWHSTFSVLCSVYRDNFAVGGRTHQMLWCRKCQLVSFQPLVAPITMPKENALLLKAWFAIDRLGRLCLEAFTVASNYYEGPLTVKTMNLPWTLANKAWNFISNEPWLSRMPEKSESVILQF